MLTTSEMFTAPLLATALLLLVAAGISLFRLERERRRYRSIRSRLETDVATMSQEVQLRLREFEEAEKERMLIDERHRIMRDVHDGLGGLLIQGIALTERDRCSPELRDVLARALTDLRLIVDSLSPADSQLAPLIASFRHLHNRSHAGGPCSFVWRIDAIGKLDIGPSRSLAILRIIQEALTNVSKHSMATAATITIALSGADAVRVSVSDNGVGIPAGMLEGKGLASMRQRAIELGTELTVDSTSAGTDVSLVVTHSSSPDERKPDTSAERLARRIAADWQLKAASTSSARAKCPSSRPLAAKQDPVESPRTAPRCES